MLGIITPYAEPIFGALIVFPFVAAMFTLPFVIINYRKYGGIAMIKTVIVYSFILYMLCAFLLTVLPLPHIEDVAKMQRIHFNWLPFKNLMEGLEDFGLDRAVKATWFSPSVWKQYLRSGQFFQIIANIRMTVPLGIYLRYYFRFDFKKTAFFGFLTSLFFELVQLSGLFFIYPQPYRCPDINDLMTNTLGAVIGFVITPLFTFILPTRDEIDYISWKKGDHATWLRQIAAVAIDWIIVFGATAIFKTVYCYIKYGELSMKIGLEFDPIAAVIYFGYIQYKMKGITIGKKYLRIKTVNSEDGISVPSFKSLFRRYFILYIIYPIAAMTNLVFTGTAIVLVVYRTENIDIVTKGIVVFAVLLLFITFCFVMYTLKKAKQLPHEYYSKTTVIPDGMAKEPVVENRNTLLSKFKKSGNGER